MEQYSPYERIAREILGRVFGKGSVKDLEVSHLWQSTAFLLEHDSSRYAVNIKGVSTGRIDDVLGLVARAILEMKAAQKQASEIPLIVVVVPGWGAKMLNNVRAFFNQYAPDIPWALVEGRRGAMHLEMPGGKSTVWYSDEPTGSSARVPRTSPSRLFTDSNAWMLKLLLFNNAPARYWSGPRGKIHNPTHLSKVADVAIQTAHSFVKLFCERDFIRVSRNKGVHIVRAGALLDMWIAEEMHHRPVYSSARSVYGRLNDWDELSRMARGESFALGGFEACRHHGVLHTVAGDAPLVHIKGNTSEFINVWDLQFCAETDAQLFFVTPRHTRSVFRAVDRVDAVPYVDLLQAALDVAPLPGRGQEQAEMIVERIIEWVEK